MLLSTIAEQGPGRLADYLRPNSDDRNVEQNLFFSDIMNEDHVVNDQGNEDVIKNGGNVRMHDHLGLLYDPNDCFLKYIDLAVKTGCF